MTPEDQDRADKIQQYISTFLQAIAAVVPGHRLTLVLRHPINPRASAVCTDDDDLNAVIEILAETRGQHGQAMN